MREEKDNQRHVKDFVNPKGSLCADDFAKAILAAKGKSGCDEQKHNQEQNPTADSNNLDEIVVHGFFCHRADLSAIRSFLSEKQSFR
jgi:hypothetical protein